MSPTSPGPSHALAGFAHGLRFDDIPAPVLERARIHILDALGIGLASTTFPFSRATLTAVEALSGGGGARIIGTAQTAAPRDAALANGVLIHGLDYDDTHLQAIVHPTAAVLPAVLAVAEQRGLSGREALAAYCVGMESTVRLGTAIAGGFHHTGFHGTGVFGHFAAALVAGRLMGAAPADHVNALGIAASTASGVQLYLEEGAGTKRLHPGWAASAGITAATLARHGFIGPSRALEGRFGLFETHLHSHAANVDLRALTTGLGSEWMMEQTALKPYPVCHYIHGAADAAGEIFARLDGAAIASVDILLPQETMGTVADPIAQKRAVSNAYEAQFSAPFVIAAMLLNGRFGLQDLSDEALANPRTRALAARCTCVTDPQSRFPAYFSGGVRVTLESGETLSAHVPINNGAGPRRLSLEAARQKFMENAGLAVSPDRAQALAEAVAQIETQPLSTLMELLTAP
ncbi:MmgE/PrpD family protein [Oceanicola sp. 502str15]|uniref:MmgE/PrpD family protein n=1 Tax=Oceanicola sp. 502str15 TaxID=2696061 RepID=UPI0020951931|nr:MmgE/PrpD family protein [Oceanicola sp. 502str15]MCO6383052.1 MmgE/PrpD family protein [Oceanicola sp. 502str15]